MKTITKVLVAVMIMLTSSLGLAQASPGAGDTNGIINPLEAVTVTDGPQFGTSNSDGFRYCYGCSNAETDPNAISVPFSATGQSSFTINFTLVADSNGTDVGTVNYAFMSGATAVVGATGNFDVIPFPEIGIQVVNASQNEGNSGTTTVNFNFLVDGVVADASTFPTSINLSVTGSADSADFANYPSPAPNFTRGNSAPLGYALNGDATVEEDETFTLSIQPGTDYVLDVANSFATNTILNDDTDPDVSIEFNSATSSADENVGDMLPSLIIEGALALPTTIDVTVAASGTATAGDDYEFGNVSGDGATTVTLEVPAGTYSAATPTPLSDLIPVEFNNSYPVIRNYSNGNVISENFTITGLRAGSYELTYSAESINQEVSGNPNLATIVNGSIDGDLVNSVANSSLRLNNANPSRTYSFTVSADQDVTFDLLAGGSSEGLNIGYKLVVAPSTFSITGDMDVESDETIDLTISNLQSGLVLADSDANGLVVSNTVYTITNDDNFNFTYQNDTDGWIDDPNLITPTVSDDINIQGGVQAVISTTQNIQRLFLENNATLTLDADVSVNAAVTTAGIIKGDGYLNLNNTFAQGNTPLLWSVNADATVNNVRLIDPDGVNCTTFNSSSLTITGNLDLLNSDLGTLVIPGSFTAPSELIFASSDTATAHITGNNDIVGFPVIKAERYISGNRAVRFLASPLSGESIYNTWQNGGLEVAGQGTHITGVASTNLSGPLVAADAGETDATTGLDITASGNASMFAYGGAAFSPVLNTLNTNHTIGTGYNIFVRGDRSIDLNSNASGAGIPTTLTTTGLIENADKSIPTVAGFNLIGNPYQSFMDMADVTTTNTTDFIYYWDPTAGSQGAYTTVTLPGGSGTLGAATNIVEPGQAFFMESSAAGTVDFERVDAISSTDASIFSTPQINNSIALKLFEANRYANGQTAQDGLIIEFSANENDAIDLRDATKFNNIDENFSIAHVATGTQLAIERRSIPASNDMIQLNLEDYTATNYSFEANVNGLNGLDVFLKDNLTGSLTQLSSGTSVVNFDVDINDPASSALDRFEIIFQNVTLSNGDDLSLENAVKVYPNPVSGDELTVVLGNYSGDVSYVLYNSLGQLITQNNDLQVTSGKIMVKNLASLTKGVYLLNITAGANTVTRRIIKQ